jgi:hypothetical protein
MRNDPSHVVRCKPSCRIRIVEGCRAADVASSAWKIRVQRDYDAAFDSSSFEDGFVIGASEGRWLRCEPRRGRRHEGDRRQSAERLGRAERRSRGRQIGDAIIEGRRGILERLPDVCIL